MSVVHVGWVTLDKRVREFSANQAASLTIKEFEAAAKAAEDEQEQLLELMVGAAGVIMFLLPMRGAICLHILAPYSMRQKAHCIYGLPMFGLVC